MDGKSPVCTKGEGDERGRPDQHPMGVGGILRLNKVRVLGLVNGMRADGMGMSEMAKSVARVCGSFRRNGIERRRL